MNNLNEFFTVVLNMSITASYAAVGVMIARLFLKKAPKIFSYLLWSVVLFRLICPISFTSDFSILRLLQTDSQNIAIMEYVPHNNEPMWLPGIEQGLKNSDNRLDANLPRAVQSENINFGQKWITVLSFIWVGGVFILFSYSVLSYVKMKICMQTATRLKDNIYESDRIGTAFTCGFLRPGIYVPLGMEENDLCYILEHERTHIQRRDYLIKPLAFFVLIFHWFSPLMWISFSLMNRDMEMSCDESVLKKLGADARCGYSNSLLNMSIKRMMRLPGNPLAFGENHVKARSKNILKYKKPVIGVIIVSIIAVTGMGIALISNPAHNKLSSESKPALEDIETEARLFSSEETKLINIGKTAAEHYYSAFMGNQIPEDCRITYYKIKDVELLAGDEKEFCVGVTSDYSTTGLYFLSANGNFIPNGNGRDCEGDYKEFRIKSLVAREYEIISIGTGGGTQGLKTAVEEDSSAVMEGTEETADIIVEEGDTGKIVEENLSIIMSSPKESSNPWDYIDKHSNEYDSILKYGGEEALYYMLSEFENGNAKGLRGQLMMLLCKEFLGVRNNVTDETLTPQEWYAALSIQKEIKLPDFIYDGEDLIENLVYAAEVEKNSDSDIGFTIVAPKIFDSFEEENLLKVFVTTYSVTYKLYEGHVLEEVSGSLVPSAITYKKDKSGAYVLENYEEAGDGAYFGTSIRDFCTMPVSAQKISGLADKIINYFDNIKNYEDIKKLQKDNLNKHLEKNGISSKIKIE